MYNYKLELQIVVSFYFVPLIFLWLSSIRLLKLRDKCLTNLMFEMLFQEVAKIHLGNFWIVKGTTVSGFGYRPVKINPKLLAI